MAQVKEWAGAHNASKLGWEVWHRNVEAKAFYATVAIATLLGVGINFSPLDPIKALFWSAVINGVVAVPVMVVIMVMAMQEKVMGQFTLPMPLCVTGWLATLVMGAVVVALFATL